MKLLKKSKAEKESLSFNNRKQLDRYIQAMYGTDQQKNKEMTIELSKEEAKKLLIGENTTLFGVQIIIK